MTFGKHNCMIDILSDHWQQTISNGKSKIKKLINTWKKDSKINFNSSDIDENQLSQQNKIRNKGHVSFKYFESNNIKKLSSNYNKRTILFRKEMTAKILFKHQS